MYDNTNAFEKEHCCCQFHPLIPGGTQLDMLHIVPPLMWISHDIFNYFNICAQYVPVNHICDNSVRQ